MAKAINETTIFVIVGVILTFLVVNFSQEMGSIYLFFLFMDYVMFDTDKFVSLPFEQKSLADQRLLSIIFAGIAFVGFIILVRVLFSSLIPQFSIQTQSFIKFLTEMALPQKIAGPALEGNKILTVLAWGIIIPIVETRFLLTRLMEWLGDSLNVWNGTPKLIFNIRTILLTFIVSAIFVMYHITAKGVALSSALIATFLFAVISIVLILYRKQSFEATLLHIINNSLLVMAAQGMINLQTVIG